MRAGQVEHGCLSGLFRGAASRVLDGLSIGDHHKSTVDERLLVPLKKSKFLPSWIDHHGNLPRLWEKMLVNKFIVAGQKDTKAGVGVMPAKNLLFRVLVFQFLMKAAPCFVSKGQIVKSTIHVGCLYEMFDFDKAARHFVLKVAADQEPADFSRRLLV